MIATFDSLCGILVLDKPEGCTSHDAVNRVRRLAGTRKVGHLGTLDPLATGVLPLVIGRATRLAQFFSHSRKAYDAVIHFSHSTTTYDREGEATSPPQSITLNRAQLQPHLDHFRGRFRQTPPSVSAKKIQGVPAYRLARQQKPVELAPVEVEIFSLEVQRLDGQFLHLAVECSPGTYIRSLAHDLGQALGCGAYVQALRRTRNGEFTLAHAHTLEALAEMPFADALLTGRDILPEIPATTVDDLTASQIRQGRNFRTSPFLPAPSGRLLRAFDASGQLVAIAEQTIPHHYHPSVVL